MNFNNSNYTTINALFIVVYNEIFKNMFSFIYLIFTFMKV